MDVWILVGHRRLQSFSIIVPYDVAKIWIPFIICFHAFRGIHELVRKNRRRPSKRDLKQSTSKWSTTRKTKSLDELRNRRSRVHLLHRNTSGDSSIEVPSADKTSKINSEVWRTMFWSTSPSTTLSWPRFSSFRIQPVTTLDLHRSCPHITIFWLCFISPCCRRAAQDKVSARAESNCDCHGAVTKMRDASSSSTPIVSNGEITKRIEMDKTSHRNETSCSGTLWTNPMLQQARAPILYELLCAFNVATVSNSSYLSITRTDDATSLVFAGAVALLLTLDITLSDARKRLTVAFAWNLSCASLVSLTDTSSDSWIRRSLQMYPCSARLCVLCVHSQVPFCGGKYFNGSEKIIISWEFFAFLFRSLDCLRFLSSLI